MCPEPWFCSSLLLFIFITRNGSFWFNYFHARNVVLGLCWRNISELFLCIACFVRAVLCGAFDEIIEVDLSDNAEIVHLALLKRLDLDVTMRKLHC